MTRRRLDISYEYDDMSRVGFWTPNAPDFLDKREKRQAERQHVSPQAAPSRPAVPAGTMRFAPSSSALRQEPSFPPPARRKSQGYTPIIEFTQIERPRAGLVDGVSRSVPRTGEGLGDTLNRPRRAPVERPARKRHSGAYRQGGTARPAGGEANRRPSRFASDQDEWLRDEDEALHEETPRGRLSQARHEWRRRKADRDFNRRYEDAPPGPAEGAPRAALYKGKMGHQYHRAARMQAQPPRLSFDGFPPLPSIPVLDRLVARPHFARAAFTALCLAFLVVSIFPAAQGYYQQIRTNDQAQAEYQAVLDRNASLQRQVETLQTDEGMEELAHESLGWVKDGEHSVSVLADGSSGAGAGSQAQGGAVAAGSVPAPTTWYSPVLDVVFGYKG